MKTVVEIKEARKECQLKLDEMAKTVFRGYRETLKGVVVQAVGLENSKYEWAWRRMRVTPYRVGGLQQVYFDEVLLGEIRLATNENEMKWIFKPKEPNDHDARRED